jgi:hypothetical protein
MSFSASDSDERQFRILVNTSTGVFAVNGGYPKQNPKQERKNV